MLQAPVHAVDVLAEVVAAAGAIIAIRAGQQSCHGQLRMGRRPVSAQLGPTATGHIADCACMPLVLRGHVFLEVLGRLGAKGADLAGMVFRPVDQLHVGGQVMLVSGLQYCQICSQRQR